MSRLLRIAIVGAESTGKSWLATQLAQTLQARGLHAQAVPEVLRLWCEREGRTPHAHEQAAIAQQQAHDLLAVREGVAIADTTPLMTAIYSHHIFGDKSLYPQALAHQGLYDMTLLTGLDLPWVADGIQRDGPHVREPIDTLLRQALQGAAVPYRVVYGQGLERLNQALLALNLPAEDMALWQQRQTQQYALNAGRTPWRCDNCSDPDCEHRLFSRLIAAD